MAAKAERVGDGNIDRHLNRLVRGDIQITLRIRLLVADGRRYNALTDCHNAGNGLNRSRAAQQMAGHGLGGGYLYVVSLVAERLFDGDGFVLLVERGRGAVRVDVVNVSRGQARIFDRAADGVRRCFAVRRRAGCGKRRRRHRSLPPLPEWSRRAAVRASGSQVRDSLRLRP